MVCPGFGLEVWLAHLLGGGVCRGHAQYPAFASDPPFWLQALQWICWSLCIFWVQNLPPASHTYGYFSSHTVSFYFVAGGEVYPCASTAAKGPRSLRETAKYSVLQHH